MLVRESRVDDIIRNATCRDFVKIGWRMGTCVRQSKDAFLNVNVDKSKQGRTLLFRGLLGLVKDRDFFDFDVLFFDINLQSVFVHAT